MILYNSALFFVFILVSAQGQKTYTDLFGSEITEFVKEPLQSKELANDDPKDFGFFPNFENETSRNDTQEDIPLKIEHEIYLLDEEREDVKKSSRGEKRRMRSMFMQASPYNSGISILQNAGPYGFKITKEHFANIMQPLVQNHVITRPSGLQYNLVQGSGIVKSQFLLKFPNMAYQIMYGQGVPFKINPDGTSRVTIRFSDLNVLQPLLISRPFAVQSMVRFTPYVSQSITKLSSKLKIITIPLPGTNFHVQISDLLASMVKLVPAIKINAVKENDKIMNFILDITNVFGKIPNLLPAFYDMLEVFAEPNANLQNVIYHLLTKLPKIAIKVTFNVNGVQNSQLAYLPDVLSSLYRTVYQIPDMRKQINDITLFILKLIQRIPLELLNNGIHTVIKFDLPKFMLEAQNEFQSVSNVNFHTWISQILNIVYKIPVNIIGINFSLFDTSRITSMIINNTPKLTFVINSAQIPHVNLDLNALIGLLQKIFTGFQFTGYSLGISSIKYFYPQLFDIYENLRTIFPTQPTLIFPKIVTSIRKIIPTLPLAVGTFALPNVLLGNNLYSYQLVNFIPMHLSNNGKITPKLVIDFSSTIFRILGSLPKSQEISSPIPQKNIFLTILNLFSSIYNSILYVPIENNIGINSNLITVLDLTKLPIVLMATFKKINVSQFTFKFGNFNIGKILATFSMAPWFFTANGKPVSNISAYFLALITNIYDVPKKVTVPVNKNNENCMKLDLKNFIKLLFHIFTKIPLEQSGATKYTPVQYLDLPTFITKIFTMISRIPIEISGLNTHDTYSMIDTLIAFLANVPIAVDIEGNPIPVMQNDVPKIIYEIISKFPKLPIKCYIDHKGTVFTTLDFYNFLVRLLNDLPKITMTIRSSEHNDLVIKLEMFKLLLNIIKAMPKIPVVRKSSGTPTMKPDLLNFISNIFTLLSNVSIENVGRETNPIDYLDLKKFIFKMHDYLSKLPLHLIIYNNQDVKINVEIFPTISSILELMSNIPIAFGTKIPIPVTDVEFSDIIYGLLNFIAKFYPEMNMVDIQTLIKKIIALTLECPIKVNTFSAQARQKPEKLKHLIYLFETLSTKVQTGIDISQEGVPHEEEIKEHTIVTTSSVTYQVWQSLKVIQTSVVNKDPPKAFTFQTEIPPAATNGITEMIFIVQPPANTFVDHQTYTTIPPENHIALLEKPNMEVTQMSHLINGWSHLEPVNVLENVKINTKEERELVAKLQQEISTISQSSINGFMQQFNVEINKAPSFGEKERLYNHIILLLKTLFKVENDVELPITPFQKKIATKVTISFINKFLHSQTDTENVNKILEKEENKKNVYELILLLINTLSTEIQFTPINDSATKEDLYNLIISLLKMFTNFKSRNNQNGQQIFILLLKILHVPKLEVILNLSGNKKNYYNNIILALSKKLTDTLRTMKPGDSNLNLIGADFHKLIMLLFKSHSHIINENFIPGEVTTEFLTADEGIFRDRVSSDLIFSVLRTVELVTEQEIWTTETSSHAQLQKEDLRELTILLIKTLITVFAINANQQGGNAAIIPIPIPQTDKEIIFKLISLILTDMIELPIANRDIQHLIFVSAPQAEKVQLYKLICYLMKMILKLPNRGDNLIADTPLINQYDTIIDEVMSTNVKRELYDITVLLLKTILKVPVNLPVSQQRDATIHIAKPLTAEGRRQIYQLIIILQRMLIQISAKSSTNMMKSNAEGEKVEIFRLITSLLRFIVVTPIYNPQSQQIGKLDSVLSTLVPVADKTDIYNSIMTFFNMASENPIVLPDNQNSGIVVDDIIPREDRQNCVYYAAFVLRMLNRDPNREPIIMPQIQSLSVEQIEFYKSIVVILKMVINFSTLSQIQAKDNNELYLLILQCFKMFNKIQNTMDFSKPTDYRSIFSFVFEDYQSLPLPSGDNYITSNSNNYPTTYFSTVNVTLNENGEPIKISETVNVN